MKKRKRAPGGGRKPKGEYSGLTAPFSLRLPPSLRSRLEDSAKRRGRSVSQEVITRLHSSLDKERDSTVRAICFLVAELAEQIHYWAPREWQHDPFLFKAFKIGVAQLLDALEPGGDVKVPPLLQRTLEALSGEGRNPALKDRYASIAQSPAAMADSAASVVLSNLQKGSPPTQDLIKALERLDETATGSGLESVGATVREMQDRAAHGMGKAKRDLGITRRRKP